MAGQLHRLRQSARFAVDHAQLPDIATRPRCHPRIVRDDRQATPRANAPIPIRPQLEIAIFEPARGWASAANAFAGADVVTLHAVDNGVVGEEVAALVRKETIRGQRI